ncbi:MAG: flagellar protein FlaG [Gammaproteobacteria bacterium]|nr:flagellar protein FlaG [Gammaproteobacteria bacterium]
MAIELKSTIGFSSNSPVQKTVSDVSPRTAPALPDTDVKKVSPERQEKPVPRFETPVPQETSAIELNTEDLDAMVSKLNDYVEQQKRDIHFSIDDDTNKTIVHLLDANGDVLKQIPSEEVLAILRGIESNKGLFFEDEA